MHYRYTTDVQLRLSTVTTPPHAELEGQVQKSEENSRRRQLFLSVVWLLLHAGAAQRSRRVKEVTAAPAPVANPPMLTPYRYHPQVLQVRAKH